MTRVLAITERQARVLIRAADKEGAIIEIDMNGVTVRLIPSSLQGDGRNVYEPEHEQETLSDWLGDRDRKRRRPSVEPEGTAVESWDPKLGKPIVADGYMWSREEFEAYLVGRPLNKRERDALQQLSSIGAGVSVPVGSVKISPGAQERLETRGYLTIIPQPKNPDQPAAYVLTPQGMKAAENV